MFDQMLESGVARTRTRQPWTILFSVALQTTCLVALVAIPLIYTDALPKGMLGTALVAAPPAPAPPSAPRTHAEVPAPTVRLIDHGVLQAPRVIPRNIAIFEEPTLPPESLGSVGGTGASAAGPSDLLGLMGSGRPPVAAVPPPTPQRIRLGGQIEAAKLITQTQPIYPRLALSAGIHGSVVLHAIINDDGWVTELQVISGHPMLAKAALEAVKQWRYQPTLLNGDPVEVDTTINVNFILGRGES